VTATVEPKSPAADSAAQAASDSGVNPVETIRGTARGTNAAISGLGARVGQAAEAAGYKPGSLEYETYMTRTLDEINQRGRPAPGTYGSDDFELRRRVAQAAMQPQQSTTGEWIRPRGEKNPRYYQTNTIEGPNLSTAASALAGLGGGGGGGRGGRGGSTDVLAPPEAPDVMGDIKDQLGILAANESLTQSRAKTKEQALNIATKSMTSLGLFNPGENPRDREIGEMLSSLSASDTESAFTPSTYENAARFGRTMQQLSDLYPKSGIWNWFRSWFKDNPDYLGEKNGKNVLAVDLPKIYQLVDQGGAPDKNGQWRDYVKLSNGTRLDADMIRKFPGIGDEVKQLYYNLYGQ
jgi:hypothetical protein